MKTLTGTVKQGANPLQAVVVLAAQPVTMEDVRVGQWQPLGETSADGTNGWSMEVESSVTEGWFVVGVEGSSPNSMAVYISRQKVTGLSAETPIALDIATMNDLGTLTE
jgi:hypothetical protein